MTATAVHQEMLKERRAFPSGLQVCGIVIGVLALVACQRSTAPESTAPTLAPRTPAFNRDIAPILFRHCGSCHRPSDTARGEVGSTLANARVDEPDDVLCVAGAPFSLIEYRDVRRHAQEIAAATRTRSMPPWPPELGYGKFTNERRLTDEQIEMIQEWVKQGALEGDPADRPTVPSWPDGWQLGTPDLVVKMPQAYTVGASGTDVFRNFVIPVPLSSTRYVRGLEFRVDNPTVVHHATIGVDRTRSARRLDSADAEPGFAEMPDEQIPNTFSWSPGKAPVLERADMAWTLEKGSDLVLQLHLVPSGKREVVESTIGLFLTDRPPTREPLWVTLESRAIDILAGQANYTVEDSYVLPADLDVISVYPHAHYLGKEFNAVAVLPDGTTKPLIRIKKWNFRWQDQYRYATPVFLPKGTTVQMHLTYDNSERNPRNPHRPPRRVQWGPRSSDEMGALWLAVLPRNRQDAVILERDAAQRSLAAAIAGAELQVRNTPRDSSARNFLATAYLQVGRIQEAHAQLAEALRVNPRDAAAHSNLGTALQQQGLLAEALEHLQEAVRLAPANDVMRFNLGNGLNAAGKPEEAMQEYRRAIRINPDNADARVNLAALLGQRERFDEAIAHLRRAIEINPQDSEAHRYLGVALGLQGKIEEAIQELRTALSIQPDWIDVQRQLDALMKTRAVPGSQ